MRGQKKITVTFNLIMLIITLFLFTCLVLFKVMTTKDTYCSTTFTYIDFNEFQGESSHCYASKEGMYCKMDNNNYMQVFIYQEGPLVCSE